MFGSDERSPNFPERKGVSGGSQKKTGFPNPEAIALQLHLNDSRGFFHSNCDRQITHNLLGFSKMSGFQRIGSNLTS
ncbi:hypothetical protein [Limnospira platensis]|uniref:hypothetical protein n=1 Tax=Limnospira platensis TaxID=118562 RepID=UPI003D6FDCBC